MLSCFLWNWCNCYLCCASFVSSLSDAFLTAQHAVQSPDQKKSKLEIKLDNFLIVNQINSIISRVTTIRRISTRTWKTNIRGDCVHMAMLLFILFLSDPFQWPPSPQHVECSLKIRMIHERKQGWFFAHQLLRLISICIYIMIFILSCDFVRRLSPQSEFWIQW